MTALALSLIMFALSTFDRSYGSAGGMHLGGGGVGIRCKGKLQVLDLYEAKRDGLVLRPEPVDDTQTLDMVVYEFAHHFWNPETIPMPDYQNKLSNMLFKPLFLGKGTLEIWNPDGQDTVSYPIVYEQNIPLSNDHDFEVNDPNCSLEQIIFFDDAAKVVKIDPTRFYELSRLDRAALSIHEISYFVYRLSPMNANDPVFGKDRKITSSEARHFTAKMLGAESLKTRSYFIESNMVPLACADEDPFENAFYSHPNGNIYRWSFKVLYQYWTPYLTYAEFARNFEKELLASSSSGRIHEIGKIIYDDGVPKDSGLRIEVSKEKTGITTIRLLNALGAYIDDGPKSISCDPARPIF